MSEYHIISLKDALYESQDFEPSTSQFYYIVFPMQHCVYESQDFKTNGIDVVNLAGATFETGAT